MANRSEHALVAAVVVGAVHALVETREEKPLTAAPLGAAAMAAIFASGPDILEPAIHPNHRQFFHSVAFGMVIGYGMHALWKWAQDGEPWVQAVKWVGLVAGGAHLVHLLMDAGTPKSIPLV